MTPKVHCYLYVFLYLFYICFREVTLAFPVPQLKQTCNQFGQAKAGLMKLPESIGWDCSLDQIQLPSFQNVSASEGNEAMAFQSTDGYSILRYSIQMKDTSICAC